MSEYDIDLIRESIPQECEITLDHALIHINNAQEGEDVDIDQYSHELDIAGRILLVLAHKGS